MLAGSDAIARMPVPAWLRGFSSVQADAEYRAPDRPDIRCASCGEAANLCALLRTELRQVHDELRAMRAAPMPASKVGGVGCETMNSAEAAAYLRLPSVRALYQAIRRGRVPVHRIGPRSMRFHRSELDAVLARQ